MSDDTPDAPMTNDAVPGASPQLVGLNEPAATLIEKVASDTASQFGLSAAVDAPPPPTDKMFDDLISQTVTDVPDEAVTRAAAKDELVAPLRVIGDRVGTADFKLDP